MGGSKITLKSYKNKVISPSVILKKSERNSIENVTLEVKENELLAIVGPVGSGKSSLLMALLGEMPSINGNVKLNGSVFYVTQEPWIFSSTIRQNILFGKEYSKEKFDEIIKICALRDVNKEIIIEML